MSKPVSNTTCDCGAEQSEHEDLVVFVGEKMWVIPGNRGPCIETGCLKFITNQLQS